jgi:hypothetical protein
MDDSRIRKMSRHFWNRETQERLVVAKLQVVEISPPENLGPVPPAENHLGNPLAAKKTPPPEGLPKNVPHDGQHQFWLFSARSAISDQVHHARRRENADEKFHGIEAADAI